MKNTKRKVKEEEKARGSQVSVPAPDIKNDFAGDVDWESEIQSLTTQEFASFDEALQSLAQAVAQKTFGAAKTPDQIQFVVKMLSANEEISEFLKTQLKILHE